MPYTHPTDDRADLRRIGVEHTRDRKTAFGEAAVVGEGLTEISGSDDDDRPLVVQAEFALDLIGEERNVVADATGAVTAEIRQVLAHLRRIHSGELGELVARHLMRRFIREFAKNTQVEGKSRQGSFRDAAAGGVRHETHDMPQRRRTGSPLPLPDPRVTENHTTYNLRP